MSYLDKFTSLVNTKQDYYQSQYISEAYGVDENINITAHYDGYINNGILNGLVLYGSVGYGVYRYILADTLIQSKGGNDNYVVPLHSNNFYHFGQIAIDTGGAGYNTFTFNNSGSFNVTANSSLKSIESNMVVSRNANDLNISFKRNYIESPTWGNVVIKKWFDKSADYKVEKFTFNSAEGYKVVRNTALLEAMVADKKITDIFVTQFLSTTASNVTSNIKVSDIEIDTIQYTISGAYIPPGGINGSKIINIDRTVKGELKFWTAVVDGVYTKAVQLSLKDYAGGIQVKVLQAKYTSGDKTDGSFNFNTQGNTMQLVDNIYASGYGVSKISFSGLNKNYIDSSVNNFLSTTEKLVSGNFKISNIDTDSISYNLAGAYIKSGGINGSKVINVDRSVKGELKFWAVVVDGIHTKAVQVLFKDAIGGINVSELQAKYTDGDKTDGSFNFNTQGNTMQLVDNFGGGGYGVSKISFTSSDKVVSGLSINEFLSRTDKFLAINAKTDTIDINEISLTIGGSYVNNGKGIVSSKNILVDRSVSGQIKFWSVVVDNTDTKAVQVLIKDTANGLLISELQAKYTAGDKTDGSFDFNNLGFIQSLATSTNNDGYGVSNITFLISGSNRFTNTINGTTNNDTLVGTYDLDLMWGGSGSDTYILNDLDDRVGEYDSYAGGFDTVKAGFSYTLDANVENLYLTGDKSANGTGNNLDNYIFGNSGNNVLDGLGGYDIISGGAGNDTYIVDNLDNVFENSNQGIDTVIALHSFSLSANFENLTLSGTSSVNGTGNALDNIIIGNSGNNSLNGQAGNDTLTGGAGADKFIFSSPTGAPSKPNSLGDNVDFVTDFSVAQGDKIVLDHNIFTALTGVTNLTDYFAKDYPKNAKNCLIYNTTNGLLAYDADGNGYASQTSIIAMFTNVPNNIDASSFIVI